MTSASTPSSKSQQITTAAVPSASGVSSASGSGGRERFALDELAITLSHYDLGIIEAIQEFPRGSRKSPKAIVRCEHGLFLLKRRAPGKDDPFKVAFCHSLQLHLAQQQFPLPHLIGTKTDNNSMLQWKGKTYELFECIKGSGYDNSLEATADSGKILGLFHKLLVEYQCAYDPPVGGYHASRSVAAAFDAIPRTLAAAETAGTSASGDQIHDVTRFLQTSYNAAVMRVNELGMPDWPMQIVHCDWHPGNMLFRGSRVVAVIDYDAARLQQRVTDVANGALQFSIIGGGDPTQWPDYIDESRFKRFLRGYEKVPGIVLSKAELRVIPWLMIEALIAESVIPIANTGMFARMDGACFLTMVQRKVRWLQQHADHLSNILES